MFPVEGEGVLSKALPLRFLKRFGALAQFLAMFPAVEPGALSMTWRGRPSICELHGDHVHGSLPRPLSRCTRAAAMGFLIQHF